MTLLAISAGWIQFIQFFVALSILILVHEWGHYFAARRTGTRVEKFYLFFDFLFPFGNILPFSLWKKKKGDTEYGIGWFPLGGYVKIAGMMDESADKEALALPPKPDEFRSKTPPQRLLIMLGGIIVNVLVAIIVYYFVFAKYGETLLPMSNLKYGIATDSLAKSVGIQDGDMIKAVDGREIRYYGEFTKELLLSKSDDKVVSITRGGQAMDIKLPRGTVAAILKNKGFVSARIPFIVDSVAPTANFSEGRLMKGDKLIGANGAQVGFYNDFATIIKASKDSLIEANAAMPLTVLRGDDTVFIACKLDTAGKLGVYNVGVPDSFFTMEHLQYNAATALSRSAQQCWKIACDYARNLRALFASKEVKVNDSLGGFGSFMKLFPDVWSLEAFLKMLGFVSILLAFMNLLPIPGLDGGYVLFTLIEMITGRKVNDKAMEVLTTIGLVLLLGLMVYANGLDIFRWLKK
jgi:regulator of sigma E protease